MPGFYKTGVVSTSDFLESKGTSIVRTNSGDIKLALPYTYVPAKDTDNTALRPVYADIDNNIVTPSTVFRIIVDVSWSGFDDSSTAGTFGASWSHQNIKREDGSGAWTTSPFCAALANQQNLKNLLLSATSGTYHYDTTLTLSQSFIDTYSRSGIGVRINYSNGVGRISFNNIWVIYEKYSTTSNIKQRFGKQYIATEEFIEI